MRHIARIPCQLVREHDFRLIADRILDVSAAGLLVLPADPVLTGERLIVSFQLPGSDYIDAEVIVTRVMHGRRDREYSRGLGLEFDWLERGARHSLTESLERLPVVPPAWRTGRRACTEAMRLLLSTSHRSAPARPALTRN
jgi:hypothetical protein